MIDDEVKRRYDSALRWLVVFAIVVWCLFFLLSWRMLAPDMVSYLAVAMLSAVLATLGLCASALLCVFVVAFGARALSNGRRDGQA